MKYPMVWYEGYKTKESTMTPSNWNIFRVTDPLCGEFTDEFPAQRPVTRNFDVSFICALINGWANVREAGDLRRHRGHYDVIIIQNLTASDCKGITNLNHQKYGDIFYNICAADRWK